MKLEVRRGETLRDALRRNTKNIAISETKRSKYRNRKVVKNGETFDSVREYERHLVLLDMQKKGEIFKLERQPRFPLFVGSEKICDYVGDWRYEEIIERHSLKFRPYGVRKQVVEDSKGFQTPEFKLKWKLCKALYPDILWRLS